MEDSIYVSTNTDCTNLCCWMTGQYKSEGGEYMKESTMSGGMLECW